MPKSKVLVVEDDEIVTIRLKNKLEEWGFEVVDIVNSGEDAVEVALNTHPDLILMDIVIKGELDGVMAAERINKYLSVPIIYLTAYEDPETIKRAKATAPDAYVLKPFADKKLKMALDITLCRHQMQTKLKDNERKYRSLFENSINGVGIFQALRDTENKIKNFKLIEFNPTFKFITGLEPAEMVGKKITEIIPNFEFHSLFRSLCDLSPEDSYRREHYSHFMNKYLDIGAFLLEDNILAVLIIDITDYKNVEKDLKSALREKNTFLREIHHRVNNNMQIISHFLNIQMECMQDPHDQEICLQTKDRITSMAMVHELLYSSQNISEINIKDYVEGLAYELLYAYAPPDQLKLKIEVDKFYFNLETAIPLGLILNELITNSIKHAFPNGREGMVNILLKKEDSKYFLWVEDDGVGLPEDLKWDDNKTVGLSLVKQLTIQMDGKMILESNNGTSCVIEFLEQEYRDRMGV